jgi:hypothetical protein
LHSEQVRALTLVTPGGLESFFVELGEPASGRRTLPADLPEPDLERVVTRVPRNSARLEILVG